MQAHPLSQHHLLKVAVITNGTPGVAVITPAFYRRKESLAPRAAHLPRQYVRTAKIPHTHHRQAATKQVAASGPGLWGKSIAAEMATSTNGGSSHLAVKPMQRDYRRRWRAITRLSPTGQSWPSHFGQLVLTRPGLSWHKGRLARERAVVGATGRCGASAGRRAPSGRWTHPRNKGISFRFCMQTFPHSCFAKDCKRNLAFAHRFFLCCGPS